MELCDRCGYPKSEHGRTVVRPDGTLERHIGDPVARQVTQDRQPMCWEYVRTYPVMGVL